MTAARLRVNDVVEPASVGGRPRRAVEGVVSVVADDGESVHVVWDKGGTAVERVEDLVLVGRPIGVAIPTAAAPAVSIHISATPAGDAELAAAVRGWVREKDAAFGRTQLRELIENNIPAYATVDQVLVGLLGKAPLARALFESDPAVVAFVNSRADAMLLDRTLLSATLDLKRIARAMQIAWDRNELGARVRYEEIVARLLQQLRSST